MRAPAKVPLELLLLLADREGQLVTRQEITERIWGKDVFLEADSAINTAIRKIRFALGDDPDQPKYVETVPGKGYRFIARVSGSPNGIPVPEIPASARDESVTASPSDHEVLTNGFPTKAPGDRCVRWNRTWNRGRTVFAFLGCHRRAIIDRDCRSSVGAVALSLAARAEVAERQLTTNSLENSVTSAAISPTASILPPPTAQVST
jgi:DNA-binding winged helix-turn-helix (wHTH) protein